jgi:hypothetical protein
MTCIHWFFFRPAALDLLRKAPVKHSIYTACLNSLQELPKSLASHWTGGHEFVIALDILDNSSQAMCWYCFGSLRDVSSSNKAGRTRTAMRILASPALFDVDTASGTINKFPLRGQSARIRELQIHNSVFSLKLFSECKVLTSWWKPLIASYLLMDWLWNCFQLWVLTSRSTLKTIIPSGLSLWKLSAGVRLLICLTWDVLY